VSVRKMLSGVMAGVLALSLCGCTDEQAMVPLSEDDVVIISGSANMGSNRFAQMSDTESPSAIQGVTLEGYKLVAENENLQLYLREENCSLRILNKKSGYIWCALPQEDPEDLNDIWAAYGESLISIKYYDETGKITQMGAGYQKRKTSKDTVCKYHYTQNGVRLDVTFKEAKISLSVLVELMEDHIRYSVDDSSIQEKGDYSLAQIRFSPFLGATRGDEIGGYMFVPDGSGALIRFQKPTKYLAGFDSRVYGSDYAIDNLFVVGDLNANRTNDFLKDTETVSMPVYGISHGYDTNAIFGYVESGAEYAAISAEPAGIITNYNRAGAYFIYRQVYQQPTGRDGSGIQMVQADANTVNPALRVYFLDGQEASYNGMAHTYRDILLKEGAIQENAATQGSLALDYIIADVKAGFLFNTTQELTDADHISQAAQWLKEQEIENATFNLLGWQKGGLNGYSKLAEHKDSQLGGLGSLKELSESLGAMGYGLQAYLAPLTAKEGQTGLTDEFGTALSQAIVQIKRDNSQVFLGDTYFLKTMDGLWALENQVQILKDKGIDVAIDQVAAMLYGDYLRNEEISRSEVMEEVVSSLQSLEGEQKLTLYRPNAYAYSATGVYRNAPMGSSRYTFQTDAIPFLQLVLSGSMTMYAPYANQSFYTDIDVLRCIEYNAYPSFLLTGADSTALRDTASEEYFSTCFNDWKGMAVSIYDTIDEVLSNVCGEQMLSHRVLQEGVVQIQYPSGSVYVNYTQEEVTVGGITIGARGAVFAGA